MKIGVYNLYWPTFGGGEQQAGGIVDALSAGHDVELLGPEGFDLAAARERLGLRLDGVSYRVVQGESYSASLASQDYDLFINHTYRSVAPNMSRRGVYFVMFPHRLDDVRRSVEWVRSAGSRFAVPVRLLGGVHHRKGIDHIVGPVQFQIEPGVQKVELEVTAPRRERLEIASVDPVSGIESLEISGTRRIQLPTGSRNAVIRPTRMEDDLDVDHSVRLVGVWVDGVRVRASPHSIQQRLTPVRSRDFIPTYQRFVTLSEYGRRWTQQWWGADSQVISPPVLMRDTGEKEQLIVSVGRFFGEDSGHSKRQLEMVKAFRMLLEQGVTGWRLVLIGGCAPEHREYAMAVRAEAAGLPVEVRIGAPGAVLDDRLARASIYWHAAGYGSDLTENPERAEHFGIAPIEAMSAGAVPVVFDAAGPAEVVEPGRTGLLYHSLEQLAAATRRLIEDEPYRQRLSVAARERALHYRRDRFEQDVRDLVDGLD